MMRRRAGSRRVMMAALAAALCLAADRGVRAQEAASVDAMSVEAVSVEAVSSAGSAFRVDLEGQDRVSYRTLRRVVTRPEFDTYSIYLVDDLVDAIGDLYRSLGYQDAEVAGRDTEGAGGRRVLAIAITEGRQYRVATVKLEGERLYPKKELYEYLIYRPRGRKPYDPRQVREDARRLEEFYVSQGYLRAAVDGEGQVSPESATAAVVYRIEPGRQYHLRQVTFAGNEVFSATRLLTEAGIRPGDPYDPTVSRAARARLRDFYGREGYVHAAVELDVAVHDDTAEVDLTYRIGEGGQVRIRSIRVEGNNKTQEKVIRREVTLAEGDLYTREKAFETRRRIFALGLFDDVDVEPAEDLVESATTDVEIRVEEGKWRRLRLAVGYNTLEGPKARLDASYLNLWGRAHEVGVSAEYKGIGDEEEIYYRIPKLRGTRYDLLGRVYRDRLEQPAYTVERIGLGLELERPYGERWRLRYRYALEDVLLRDVSVNPADLDINESEGVLSKAGVTVIRDARDNAQSPHRGLLSRLDVDVGGGVLLGDFHFVKTDFRTAWYLPITKRTTLALSGRVGWLEPYGDSGETPVSERFLLGGDDTIRGFPRNEVGPRDRDGDPVGGDAMLLFNAEYRFPVYKQLYGGIFFDTGNVWPDLVDVDLGELRESAGVGIRYRSPIGVVRLDYGHVLDRQEGEDGWRIHFGVGYAF